LTLDSRFSTLDSRLELDIYYYSRQVVVPIDY
jgi:hypothetical protein